MHNVMLHWTYSSRKPINNVYTHLNGWQQLYSRCLYIKQDGSLSKNCAVRANK